MINIKQLTNNDITQSTPTKSVQVVFPDKTIDVTYYKMVPVHSFTKMGYCCEPKGIGYPIFLDFSGNNSIDSRYFLVGKTGMFEFQDEIWKNINESEEEYTASITCYAVWVPQDIKFTLEYSYEE